MRVFRFDMEAGYPIERFDSGNAVFSRIVRTDSPVSVGCIHLGADSVVGYHPAVVNQLFLVVAGKGWVRGEEELRIPITAGQAVFWTAGEGHESGSESGMTAIVIEGEGLDPAKHMPLLAEDQT